MAKQPSASVNPDNHASSKVGLKQLRINLGRDIL